MQDLMVSCQEISWDDLQLSRSGGQGGPATDVSVASAVAELSSSEAAAAIVIDPDPTEQEPSEEVVKALKWSTNMKDDALVKAIAKSLPAAARHEQLQLYNDFRGGVVTITAKQPEKLVVYPHLLKSRMQVAALYDK